MVALSLSAKRIDQLNPGMFVAVNLKLFQQQYARSAFVYIHRNLCLLKSIVTFQLWTRGEKSTAFGSTGLSAMWRQCFLK